MKSYVLKAQGAPLQLEERDIPQPGRRQVVVKNLATSLNFHDVLNIQGLGPNMVWPHVPFSDNCGEIISLGDDCGDWQIGQRVFANFFPDWLDGKPSPSACWSLYGDNRDGFLQEYTAVESRSLVRVPQYLTNLEAATFGCAGLTAWRSLVAEGGIKPGHNVLVLGTGGVSIFAIQFAKLFGAKVFLTSSSDEKLEFGKGLGADVTINYSRHTDWDQQVLDATNGIGADIVVEVGGADTLAKSVNAARFGGHISIIGMRSGAGVPTPILPELLLIKSLTMRGIAVGSASHLEDMCRALELNPIRPVIHQTYAMDEVAEAIAMMDSQQHIGKLAIEIQS